MHAVQVKHLEGTVAHLKKCVGNALQAFGGAASQLTKLLSSETCKKRFHRCPVGPVGRYLSLKDSR